MNPIREEMKQLMGRLSDAHKLVREAEEAVAALKRRCPHKDVGEYRCKFPPYWTKFCRDCGKDPL